MLRRLACELAQVAQQSVHKDKARLWTALNALEPTRPLVLIDQIPWHEMNVGGELDLQCTGPWARQHEQSLRRTLYQWRHMPADMVVPAYVSCPLTITNTGTPSPAYIGTSNPGGAGNSSTIALTNTGAGFYVPGLLNHIATGNATKGAARINGFVTGDPEIIAVSISVSPLSTWMSPVLRSIAHCTSSVSP